MASGEQRSEVLGGGGPVELAGSVSGPADGLPVIQLHGLGSSRAREDLAGSSATAGTTGLRVLRIDAPGHGRSAGSPDPAMNTWASYAHQVAQLVAQVFPGRQIHGVGSSMGAGTLLHAAVGKLFPLASLSLLIPPTAWESRVAQSAGYIDGAEFITAHGFATFVNLLAQQAPPPGMPERPFVAPDLIPDTAAAVYLGAARSDLPGKSELRDVHLPVQILAWAGDPAHPVSTAQRLREYLAAADFEVSDSLDQIAAWPERVSKFIHSVT